VLRGDCSVAVYPTVVNILWRAWRGVLALSL